MDQTPEEIRPMGYQRKSDQLGYQTAVTAEISRLRGQDATATRFLELRKIGFRTLRTILRAAVEVMLAILVAEAAATLSASLAGSSGGASRPDGMACEFGSRTRLEPPVLAPDRLQSHHWSHGYQAGHRCAGVDRAPADAQQAVQTPPHRR